MSGNGSHTHSHGHDNGHGHGSGHGEQPDFPEAGVHGMLVVGEKTLYLSHLPMFGHPQHDVQAILEVHLADETGDAQATYLNDRRSSGEPVYTLAPEHFVLQHLVTPEPGKECLCEFTGTLVRGHFERGGTAFLSDVPFVVDHVVHFRQFDPHADELVAQKYIFFGNGEEQFLAHLITRPPDFDQVLAVRVSGRTFSDEELRQGPILFFPRRSNRSADRLRPGEQLIAMLEGERGQVGLEIGTEFYLEEGELAG